MSFSINDEDKVSGDEISGLFIGVLMKGEPVPFSQPEFGKQRIISKDKGLAFNPFNNPDVSLLSRFSGSAKVHSRAPVVKH